VQNGRFGACLMAEPNVVAECVQKMQAAVAIPITVKSRIGIDDLDSYQFLHTFIDKVSQAGCEHFIVHARKAWLSGLSPKQNREVPPLDYERVYQLKRDFNHVHLSINGGVKSYNDVNQHLKQVDGVMIGREIYQTPYMLTDADQLIWQSQGSSLSRAQVIEQMACYIDQHVAQGGRVWHVVRHMLGLCNGLPGARKFRRYLSENAGRDGANSSVLHEAFALVLNA
jgi:tRNA-dihydrouridine synthase A